MVGGHSDLLTVSPSRSEAAKKHGQTAEDDNATFHFRAIQLCIMSNAFSRGVAGEQFCVHCFESLALVHNLHHVTRDTYADLSGQAHSIEYEINAT
jgi:hypothetical protein